MPNPLRWLWDHTKRAYRKITGGSSVASDTVTNLRNSHNDFMADYAAGAANDLLTGNISLNRWMLDFRQELKKVYINQYRLARGGTQIMTQADWGSIGGMLKRQYEYMNRFADEIAAGRLSAAQIEQRMKLYFNSSTQAFERGKARSAGLPVLPQFPGDGRTQCRTNCRCEWEIHETELGWDCFWRLNPAEHCPDCVRNSQQWNPLFIPRF